MTQAQAREELQRLADGLRLPLRDVRDSRGKVIEEGLTEEQIASWMRVLMGLVYERGRATVTKMIDSWTWKRWPSRGDFIRVSESLSSDGIPNAGAYSQDRPPSREDREQLQVAYERQEHWIAIDDGDYFDEVVRPLMESGRMWSRGG